MTMKVGIFVRELLEDCFSKYRWYRKRRGGKWERWWVDVPVCADVWHRVDEFTYIKVQKAESEGYKSDFEVTSLDPYWWGFRPTPLCCGTPTLEEWSK